MLLWLCCVAIDNNAATHRASPSINVSTTVKSNETHFEVCGFLCGENNKLSCDLFYLLNLVLSLFQMSLLRLFDVTSRFIANDEEESERVREDETRKYSLFQTLEKLETLFPDCMQSAERWLHFLVTNRKKTFHCLLSLVFCMSVYFVCLNVCKVIHESRRLTKNLLFFIFLCQKLYFATV